MPSTSADSQAGSPLYRGCARRYAVWLKQDPPVRLRLFGENLVGFRDTDGNLGILDASCANRGAPLCFGCHEDCGLYCVYHGWKFDVHGACNHIPHVPKGDTYQHRAWLKAIERHRVMDFGITLATSADSWQVVQRAEALGFTHAWFYDTQMLNADPFVAMAAAAMKTHTIHLGTGVLVPSNRIAPVTANCLASLNKLAPGRIHFGVATGFTARRAMGLGAVKLDEMAAYIRLVQGLLRRDTVEADFEGQARKIRFLNPELDLINTRDEIPLYLSAFGPRSQALTAQLGAGWIYSVRNPEQSVEQLQRMQHTWRDAGRAPSDLYAVAQGSGCVMAPGEAYDSPKAKAQADPSAVMILHDLVEASAHRPLGYRVPEDLRPLLDAYQALYAEFEPAEARYLQVHRWHLMKLRPEEAHLATSDLIKKLTSSGTTDTLREGIRALRDAGFAQFAVHIRYGQDTMLAEWAEVLSGV